MPALALAAPAATPPHTRRTRAQRRTLRRQARTRKRCRTVWLLCQGERHRLRVHDGRVHFTRHEPADLRFLTAMRADGYACAEVLARLRSRDPKQYRQLPEALTTALQEPADRHKARQARAAKAATAETGRQTLWTRIHKKHFAPLLEDAQARGLRVAITAYPRSAPPAVLPQQTGILLWPEGGAVPIARLRSGRWEPLDRPIAEAARTYRPDQLLAFWGESGCRVCSGGQPDAPAEEPWMGIEELPRHRRREPTLLQHAQSRAHLIRIREVLLEVLDRYSLPTAAREAGWPPPVPLSARDRRPRDSA